MTSGHGETSNAGLGCLLSIIALGVAVFVVVAAYRLAVSLF